VKLFFVFLTFPAFLFYKTFHRTIQAYPKRVGRVIWESHSGLIGRERKWVYKEGGYPNENEGIIEVLGGDFG